MRTAQMRSGQETRSCPGKQPLAMPHRRLPRVDLPRHTYALTCCLDRRRRLFADPDLCRALIDLWAEARERGDIVLHGYVIMPDHYHVLATLTEAPSISNVVRRAHSTFARMVRSRLVVDGRVWQRRFWDHVIRDDEDWRTKLRYLHDNPVRAGLVEYATDYPWSSASFWETGTGPVTCEGAAW
jgi:putative transposase